MTRKKILWAIIILFALWMVPYCKRWWEIDRCLDNGGRWDYENRVCEFVTKEQ